MGIRALSTAGVALLILLLVPLVPVAAESQPEVQEKPEPPAEVTTGMLADSVTQYSPVVTQFSAEESIEPLGYAESEEDVIVLEADILFAAMEWELPDAAGSKIEELVEEVPEGAAVEVNGHTDSNPVPEGHDFDNQVLSENRAEAVAQVLEDGRPDLELSVEGFGEDQPAVEEDEEDPDTFAANRRVEIRYD